MVYHGRIQNGVVVLDDMCALPEGAVVHVQLADAKRTNAERMLDESGQTLGQKLMKFAGQASGLPPDAARNVDHYLYGTPKR